MIILRYCLHVPHGSEATDGISYGVEGKTLDVLCECGELGAVTTALPSIALFGLPDERRLIGYGPFTRSARCPDDGVAFYRNDFGLTSEEPWFIPARWEIVDASTLPGAIMPRIDWQAPDAASFAQVFQEISQAIRRGVFEKTVPVSVERGELLEGDLQALANAFARVPAPKISYAWIDGDAGFAGATPELLFALEGQQLQTMALAGTARSEEREILAVDEKEIREHEFVAQSLMAKLADLGTLIRQERNILDLGPIVHFQTLIHVDLEQTISIDALLRKLHPTPALGPLPRTKETMELLLGWRQALGCPPEFGAPFGLWHDNQFRAVVAIRGIWWSGSKVFLPAGCGVIEASRMVNEWRELRLKREAVKSAIGI
ncbi:MAG: chorismate-binding protein [Akkermansiaceae bacterium]